MFSPQLGNFPFASTKSKQDSSTTNNLTSRMETNNGAGDSNQSQIDKTKLIVNYIPQFATEDDLAQIFAPIGRVESVKIMRDYKTGYSFGFGFVKYSTPEDATKAIEVLNGYNFRNKRLKVSYSRPPGTDMKDSNLYITNLPKDITEQQIDTLFREFGEIVQRTVLKDKVTGMPRGVAFVRFSKGEEAQAAIANLHGKMLENAMLPLSVRVAEDHGRQKAQYVDMWDPMGFNRDPDDFDDDTVQGPDPEEILIAMVCSRRPLWDNTTPLIERTQSKLEVLWKEVIDKFDGQFNMTFILKKWQTLKDNYFLAHKKVVAYVPRWPGDQAPRPTFPYYEQMKFLNATFNINKSIDTISGSSLGITSFGLSAPSGSALCKHSGGVETEDPPAKKHKSEEPVNDGIRGFMILVEEGLRNLPLKSRTKIQIKILELLENEPMINNN